MPFGISRLKSWLKNENVSNADLNAEFNNILNKAGADTLSGANSTSGSTATVAAMQATENPGGVGTEVVSTSVQEDIKQLRYMFSQIVGGAQWYSPPPSSITNLNNSMFLQNFSLATSVAANNLTIALKDKSGNDPSGSSVVTIGFRNSTSATGTYNSRSISTALSLVVNSGTTLGTQSGTAATIYVYALDNSGTVELAVSLALFDEGSVQTTTAISGGASPTTLYSTTARSNVPIRLIGRLAISEAAAGTWGTNATEIANVPFPTFAKKAPTVQKFTSTGTTAGYVFVITSASATAGATYTNSGNTFTVLATISGLTTLYCSGTGAPAASGNLVKASGTGDATIVFSSAVAYANYVTPTNPSPVYLEIEAVGGGGGGGGSGTTSGTAGTGGGTTYFGTGTMVRCLGGVAGTRGGDGALGNSAQVNSPAIGYAVAGGQGGSASISGSSVTTASPNMAGGSGGASFFGGGGCGGSGGGTGAGSPGVPYGSGGGGGNTQATTNAQGGAGGGAGGYAKAIVSSPSATYPYVVGPAGTGQAAGTAGYIGGDAAPGIIIVREYY